MLSKHMIIKLHENSEIISVEESEHPCALCFQMNRATPRMRHFAKRLIDFEARENKLSATKTPPVFDVCEKLRPQLAALMGNGGFQALLARALLLASAEVLWLRAIHVKADGTLEGVEEQRGRLAPAVYLEGRVVLVARLLGLLAAFIGEKLTLRLVREVWPQVPVEELNFGKGEEEYEKNP
jgi:hypothetical protein